MFSKRFYEEKGSYVTGGQLSKVEVVDEGELSDDEERHRIFLEKQVEKAFYQAGQALREIATQINFASFIL